jgi:hypothetical protein
LCDFWLALWRADLAFLTSHSDSKVNKGDVGWGGYSITVF